MSFGWNYPPGVTGNEPEIAWYPEDVRVEQALDSIFRVAEQEAPEGVDPKQYAARAIQLLEVTHYDGPDEDEIYHVAYTAHKRMGLSHDWAVIWAHDACEAVWAKWDRYLRIWSDATDRYDDGPDPDAQRDAMLDREWDRDY